MTPDPFVDDGEAGERISLNAAAAHLLDECRMVLPGIQALFGFQLIAVFDLGFSEKLSAGEQRLHLLAIVLVVVAIALVMAPAAIHRQVDPRTVHQRFIDISSRLLLWSMLPLALGICLDVYLVGWLVLRSKPAAGALAVGLLGLLLVMWFVLPRSRRFRRLNREEGLGRVSRATAGVTPPRSIR